MTINQLLKIYNGPEEKTIVRIYNHRARYSPYCVLSLKDIRTSSKERLELFNFDGERRIESFRFIESDEEDTVKYVFYLTI